MKLQPHPRSPELEQAIKACLPLLAPWAANVFRMVEAPYANERDLLSGAGAAKYGQRWNPPGIPTAYACLDDALAILEWKQQRRKAGMSLAPHLPLTQVTIVAALHRLLDLRQPPVIAALGLPLLPFITEPHQSQIDDAPELLAQAFGRLATQLGVEALIVPAAPDPTRYNLVIYRPNLAAASILNIHGAEYLPPPRPLAP